MDQNDYSTYPLINYPVDDPALDPVDGDTSNAYYRDHDPMYQFPNILIRISVN